jgi:hypothetical protein
VDFGLLHHLLGFARREHGLRQSDPQARQFELTGRVVQDVMMPRHPLEPDAQRDQAVVLAGEAQRLAVLLAVVEHVALIAFEHRARYFDRLRDGSLGAPVEEEADVHTAALDSVFGVILQQQIFEVFL